MSCYDPIATKDFDGKYFTHFTNDKKDSFNNVRSIIEDKKGNIWIGGHDGLYKFDPAASKTGSRSLVSVTANFTGYIFEDKKGNLWLSEGIKDLAGFTLRKYDPSYILNNELAFSKIKSSGMVFGITEDKNGNIWFGTERGVYRYDPTAPSGKEFTNFLE